MAKLNPKDPQFGIPVATRIREDLAIQFNNEAEKQDKTLSRYIADFIEVAAANEELIKELEARLTVEGEAIEHVERALKELEAELAKEKEISVAKEKPIQELQAQLTKEKGKVAAKENRIKELEAQLIREKDIARKVAGKFILNISEGNKKQATQLIETYNTILKDERNHNA